MVALHRAVVRRLMHRRRCRALHHDGAWHLVLTRSAQFSCRNSDASILHLLERRLGPRDELSIGFVHRRKGGEVSLVVKFDRNDRPGGIMLRHGRARALLPGTGQLFHEDLLVLMMALAISCRVFALKISRLGAA